MQQPLTTAPAPALTRLANTTWSFSQRYWRIVVVAMLALLHVAVFRGVADPWARALLLAHLGLLLLWQPFLRADEQRVSLVQGLIIALAASAVMLWLDWWLLAFWVVVLAGLVGGKVYQQHARWQRRCYLVVLFYLLALLAIAILPEIAPRREIDADIRGYAEFLLPLAFVLIALLPTETDASEAAHIIDFFYSMFLMLLLVVIILGSFTFMTLRRMPYLEALTFTVFLTAGAVLLVALAWNPRTGGVGVFFARYLFSIGLPVEKWLRFLAELQQREARPERFLEEAVAALLRVPSVAGARWRAGQAGGEQGARTTHAVDYHAGELELTIYSRYRLGPALLWHLHLLGQLLGEFHAAKLREEKLRQASYLQAVHETGARMTHDIKNLLQSLNVLCSVATGEDNRDPGAVQALLRRQLPLMAQRLSATLEKLQRPRQEDETYVAARAWWEMLARQYGGEGIELEGARPPAGVRLPRWLFDSVAANLIRNAIAKRASDGAVRVRVTLDCAESVALRVCDTGGAVPEALASKLMRAPVDSQNGLGIGLYQAARQAQAAGYRLALEANRDGEVCFALTGPRA
ncbi:MAG TPA: ATP-binding protein [Burkholderiales bacterium]|nr:ATP-binding protein [Burkholderiales bacterium]